MQDAKCEEEVEKQGALYTFPSVPRGSLSRAAGPNHDSLTSKSSSEDNNPAEELDAKRARRRSLTKCHARSASHGGVLATSTTGWLPGASSIPTHPASAGPRPSALKKPGHQRAFSQGQVVDVQGPVTGHSRVGSKTDFILPPGHREDPPPPLSAAAGSFRGHSRQASRLVVALLTINLIDK